jgi:polyhydroxyalkanoate synthesis regulator phasin
MARLSHSDSIQDYYDSLMKHKNLLDPDLLKKYITQPLRSQADWPDEAFSKWFESVRSNMTVEDAVFLVAPLVENVIDFSLRDVDAFDNPKKVFDSLIAKYREYVEKEAIQQILKERFQDLLSELVHRDYVYLNLMYSKVLRPYIKGNDEEIANIINAHMRIDSGTDIKDLIKNDFPKEWINSGLTARIEEAVVKQTWLNPWNAKEYDVPHLEIVNLAVKKGFMSQEKAKEITEDSLKSYKALRIAPSGQEALHFLKHLNPDLVTDRELLAEVINKALKHLNQRKKQKEAIKLHDKFVAEGIIKS